jgi:primosomal protein N'
MTFVRVVPIRRLPTILSTLTYHLPDGLTVQPGALVYVPLRGRRVMGIVWDVTTNDDQVKTQAIADIIVATPVITPWLRRVMTVMAETSASSLGDVAFSIFPKLSPRTVTKKLVTTKQPSERPSMPTRHVWYRRRSEAMNDIVNLCQNSTAQTRIIITPTLEDVRFIVETLEHAHIAATTVNSGTTPSKLIELWQRALQDERIVVVGTLRAIALPCLTTPDIYFDQSEHHAHKVTAQHPRFSAAHILDALQATTVASTSAPTLANWSRYPQPEPSTPNRYLASLNRDRAFSWLTDETISLIDRTVEQHQRVWCIVPNIGYANSVSCRQCGYVVACPTCQRRASMMRGTHDAVRCVACATTFSLPDTCPTCRGTTWSFHGLGRERAIELLQQQWPNITVAPDIGRDVGADMIVGTYGSYQAAATAERLGLMVVLSGDALLNIADYSTAERAWQFLARLRAWSNEVPTIVQTFQPDLPFWQRWRSADDQRWYEQELADRQRLNLPPSAKQWIARFAGPDHEVSTVVHELTQAHIDGVTVERLPARPRSRQHRLILTFTKPDIASTWDWTTYFPTPWQVDMNPSSWLD